MTLPQKQWLVLGLDSGIHWPTTETSVYFRGYKIILRPETHELAPTLAFEFESPMTFDEALLLLRQFLSSLAWVRSAYVRETMITGGSHPIGVGKGPGARLIDPRFRLDYLADPDDQKAQIALALYREALNVNSVTYQFLGFFKIINILYKSDSAQKGWINNKIELLENHQAKARLSVLRKEIGNIGKYLYESGRCAVAHAFSKSLVNPDEPDDLRRLTADLPVIRALAEHLIEHELKVPSQRTVWREHLYELEGFRALLGADVLHQLIEKRDIPLGAVCNLPRVNIRLRDYDPFPVFENLHTEALEAAEGHLLLQCTSDDKCVRAGLSLNFAEERLEFDLIGGVELIDDGSSLAIRNALDRVKFIEKLYKNGQLEVWDAEQKILLGRCDPFIPVNIDFRKMDDYLGHLVEELEAEATRRTVANTRNNVC